MQTLRSAVVSIGDNLKRFRLERGISQLELSKRSGVTPATISRIEQEINPNPRRDTILNLADALEVSIAELVGSSDAERGLSQSTHDPKLAHVSELFTQLDDAAQDDILRVMERMAGGKRKKPKLSNGSG